MGRKPSDRERVLREEFSRVKHDNLFTDWKVLVGSKDWAEHKAGKEGVARYHLHNLPKDYFGPGVYELGIISPASISGRRISGEDVNVVYVGQAATIRERLQSHGRGSSHLGSLQSEPKSRVDDSAWISKDDRTAEGPDLTPENLEREDSLQKQRQGFFKGLGGLSVVKKSERKGRERSGGKRSLLEDAFLNGYTVVFRWAKASSKDSAISGEAQLLHYFDYAWNQRENGERRLQDVLVRRVRKPKPQGCWFRFKDPAIGVVLDLQNERVGADVKLSSPRIHRQQPESATPNRSARDTAIGSPQGFASLLGHNSRGKARQSIPFDHLTKSQSVAGGVKREGGGKVAGNVGRRMSRSGSFPEGTLSEEMPNVAAGQSVTVAVCGARLDGGESCGAAPLSRRKRCASHKGMRASIQVRA